MKSFALNRQINYIRRLIKSTAESTNSNLELQGHWGKYLCILAAGFLENAISEIYSDLVNSSSSPQVASFARITLEKINNPKAAKFIETAFAFKKEWGTELENYFKNNLEIKEAINSIMTNRHLIAHGKPATISVGMLAGYFDASLKAIEFIEKQCGVAE